ncbi:DUF4030 domain-containing protein [Bacillus marasmi]|uniref:DUF4030 domain-containing protein n=1 Tax=Bacillus marasmi TaxID=1926279 RepID=UPI0011CAEF14|nr:DUF4030 domain-containing protein [Bacillus marasmi]
MRKQYEDTDLDASLKKANSDLLWKNKQQQNLKKNILSDIEKLDLQEDIKNPVLSPYIKSGRVIPKLTYTGIALVILLSLLIGSAYFSPTMAEVIAKIPYLNQVFHTEPVQQTIAEKLQSEGFKIDGISTRGKKIEIQVKGSELYFHGVRKDIEEIAIETLKARDYDAYTVKVIRNKMIQEKIPSPETLKQVEEATKVDEALQQEFKKHKYLNVVTQVGTLNNAGDLFILIGIPNTEKKTEEIKELARNVITEQTKQKYTLEFKKINLEIREQESRWGRVISTIIDGLYSKKEFQVNGFSFSAHPQPMTLYIKTTISSSNPDSKQLGIKIENTVKDFLESKEAREIIKDDEYQIIVYSKDKQKLN